MAAQSEPDNESKHNLFQRFKTGLTRTRNNFNDGLADLLLGEKPIDGDLLDDLETALLTADVGLDTTRQLIDELQQQVPHFVRRRRHLPEVGQDETLPQRPFLL